jgi:hypothetical protein
MPGSIRLWRIGVDRIRLGSVESNCVKFGQAKNNKE